MIIVSPWREFSTVSMAQILAGDYNLYGQRWHR
jgi:hypothetical protein